MRKRYLLRKPINEKTKEKNKEKYLISQNPEGKEEPYIPFDEDKF